MMRIGQGYDVHAFTEGRPLILGGVTIPYSKGLAGHSDADVLLHALCDALLGAAAMADIGKHFPDTDPAYAGADSRQLLRDVMALLIDKNFSVVNIDCTVIAQAPKLASYIAQMCQHIANDCSIDINCVNVKATTTEKLGFTGRGEGIAAMAVVLLD